MIDLLDLTIAKAVLLKRQTQIRGAVDESVWLERLVALRIENPGEVIQELVKRGEVRSYQRFGGADVPGMYMVIR